MKYICTGLIIIMMLAVAPGFAASEKDTKYPAMVEPNTMGEGIIQKIAGDGKIIINDTLLTFSSSPMLQYENGDYLSRSSLKKGNKVLYHVNSKLEIILLVVRKK
ncbi:MAG: hypothetical protein SWH54_02790 [Thermodesulfobacteriota bacterium]|nr:hypothetical protein [Thermodesulfobacteriota bacterium]